MCVCVLLLEHKLYQGESCDPFCSLLFNSCLVQGRHSLPEERRMEEGEQVRLAFAGVRDEDREWTVGQR